MIGAMDTTGLQDPATVAERFYAHIAAGRIDRAVELAAPDFVGHGIGGRDELRAELDMWADAFPDVDITIEDTIAEDDRVAVRMRVHGTHTGTFAGIAPSGRGFDIRCTDVVRIVDGQVVEAWPLLDLAGLLVQVGAMPVADADRATE